MLWVCVLIAVAVLAAAWAGRGRSRAVFLAGDAAAEPTAGANPAVAAGPAEPGPLSEEERAGRDRLLACLDAMFADDGPAAGVLAVAATALPPDLAANAERLSSGMAGSQALARLHSAAAGPRLLAECIGLDPILTGHVLRIANSPLFGLRAQVTSLEQAIGVLGLSNLRTLLYTELLEQAAAKAGFVPGLRRSLWAHLGRTAVMARHIAPALPGLDPQALHTMGLLHDVGRLVLYGPGDVAFLPTAPAEDRAFGVNHAVAGAVACAGFHLPQGLCQGVRLHHAPFYVELEDLEADLTAIRYGLALCLADRLAWALEGRSLAAKPAVRPSYRFLVNEAVLSRVVAGEALYVEMRQAMSLLGMAG
uniref:HDOD domain-containing protein n=1 Tax=Desulfovibrio sp. U5L TaxID=596152 RepID=I2Q5U9_9BACT